VISAGGPRGKSKVLGEKIEIQFSKKEPTKGVIASFRKKGIRKEDRCQFINPSKGKTSEVGER